MNVFKGGESTSDSITVAGYIFIMINKALDYLVKDKKENMFKDRILKLTSIFK